VLERVFITKKKFSILSSPLFLYISLADAKDNKKALLLLSIEITFGNFIAINLLPFPIYQSIRRSHKNGPKLK
jgi:hypothetical protein